MGIADLQTEVGDRMGLYRPSRRALISEGGAAWWRWSRERSAESQVESGAVGGRGDVASAQRALEKGFFSEVGSVVSKVFFVPEGVLCVMHQSGVRVGLERK